MGFNDMTADIGEWTMWMIAVGAVFWLASLVAVLLTLRNALLRASRVAPPPLPERGLEVLARRYAAGEIDADEFLRKRQDLSDAAAEEPGVTYLPGLHLVTQARSAREIGDMDWGPRPVA